MNILHVLTSRRRLGNLGENAAARFLKRHRYKILERNYVGKRGEIDIIASKKKMMVFVEVKTRSTENANARESRPSASVDSQKQRRLIHVANEYARTVHKENGCMMRMDIIEVYTETINNKLKIRKIVHIENAFNMNSAYKTY